MDLDEDEDMADFAPPKSPLTPVQPALPDEVSHSDDEDADVEVAECEQTTPEPIETVDVATQTEEPTQAVNAMTIAATVQHRFAQLLEVGTREQVEHVLHQLMSAAVAYNPRPYLDDRAVRTHNHLRQTSCEGAERANVFVSQSFTRQCSRFGTPTHLSHVRTTTSRPNTQI